MTHKEYIHKSVLVNEVLEYLNPQPGKVYLDVTFGGGGHSRALLTKEPNCSLVALDWDANALELNGAALQEEFPGRVTLLWGNFALLYKLIKNAPVQKFDGILADFGTSQYQISQTAGFSFSRNSPLDMRMSPAHQRATARDVINHASEEKLRQIFWQLGEEQHTKQIVRAIAQQRAIRPIETTLQLAALIEKVVGPGHRRIHPATKVFQALRIYVNKELENINSFLAASLTLLNDQGRLVCISFHSLEDGLVKDFFKEHEYPQGPFTVLTKSPIIAQEAEVAVNPSSRSAKLRAAQYNQR